MQDNQIDPGHNAVRDTLRVVGPVVVLIGLGFIIVGSADFFRTFGSFAPPKLIWCVFVGLLLLPVGIALCRYGYMGKVMRYTAQEMAPAGKDTFNYLAEGTRESIKTVAGAIGEGLREGGLGGGSPAMVRCHKCNALAPADAKFCSQCGHALGKTKPCPHCQELNDPVARFCDKCGQAFGENAQS
jgi:ribosomal protein L40E